MEAMGVIKQGFETFKNNVIAYMLGTLIAMLGSMLIVTAPPLIFGLYFMAVKGSQGHKVEVVDVFNGFNYFIKSWTFYIIILMLAGLGFAPGFVLILLSQKIRLIHVLVFFLGFIWIIIWNLLLVYAKPIIIAQDKDVIESIKISISYVKKKSGFTIRVLLIGGIINFVVGFIPLLGMLFANSFNAICLSKAAIEIKG